MLERCEEGAVESLSPCRREELLKLEPVWLEGAAVPGEPRWLPAAPLLFLEMDTTRLSSWFSELVRVRTGRDLFGSEGLVPVGRVLEVGRFLVDDLEEVSDSAFPCSFLLLSSADCSVTGSVSSLVEPFTSSS